MAEREVRYCTTDDGVQIAFCVEGQGPPLMVTSIFVESFALDHLCPEYRRYLDALAEGRTLIRWDARGVGMSPYDGDDLTTGMFTLDIKAVQEALGFDQVALYGTSTCGPIAIEYTARYPGRVSRLILYGSYPRVAAAVPEALLKSFADLALANWPMACQLYADMTGRREFPETAARLADWYQESSNGAVAAGIILSNITWDTTPQLAKIDIPTLVVHRVNDPTYSLKNGRAIAAGIKNARFVPVEGHAHLPSAGNPAPILQSISAFLDEDPATRRPQSEEHPGQGAQLKIVLFTDIVGHTEMMQRLGDAKGRDVLREHERITRDLLKEHGGAEVKTMGDGFMASFASVTKAMDCAIALQRAFAAHTESMPEPLHVRVGLNAGEPIEEDGDLFGATVIMASRIAAKAGAGEILVPDTVRGLLSGKGFMFGDRGEFIPKGFDEGVRLWDVRWTE
jgi:class 3 adenylate cyclase/pimeloyl-ACP methyl ester carboxylesterase